MRLKIAVFLLFLNVLMLFVFPNIVFFSRVNNSCREFFEC